MPTRESYAQGTPSWVDLATTDMEGAKAFYGALFGWEFHTAPEPEAGGYTMALLEGKAAAAMMPQPQEQIDMGIPPCWNQYITVDDIDATVGAVEAAGGSVMAEPFDVFTAGRMGVIVDPTGAVVCLWQPGDNIGSEIVNQPGAFTWAELQTNDQDAAAEFYTKLLGLTSAQEDLGEMGTMTMFLAGEEVVGATMNTPVEGVPPHWHVYFGVADADASVAKVAEMGGTVLAPPFDIPPGRMATVQDPAGAVFSIIALAEQPE